MAQRWGQTLQLIFTQNGLIEVNSHKDVPFSVKIKTFQTLGFYDMAKTFLSG